MKNTYKSIFFGIVTVVFASCAFHSGYMNNSVSLSQANFNYVEQGVFGKSTSVRFYGIGGLSKSAIVDEAKQDLVKKYPLSTNQALANISVNWKNGFYFFVQTRTCTVTADIVEFHQ